MVPNSSMTVTPPSPVKGGEAMDVKGAFRPGAHSYSQFQSGYLNRRLFDAGPVVSDARVEVFVFWTCTERARF